MKILHDKYMIVVDQEFDVIKMKSGLDSVNGGYFEDEQESKYRFKRQWGTLVNLPATFTDEIFDLIDTGIPQQRKFIPSEFIQGRANMGYTKLPVYWPSTFDDYQTVTNRDLGLKMSLINGDKVYFDYTVTDKENIIGKHQGKDMFQVNVDQIYCAVRKERSKIDKRIRRKIIMQGGWVLVIPDMETWNEIKLDNGFLKKPQPEAKTLSGFVKHISPSSQIKPGDHIIYIRDADYSMIIEGVQYYVMRESDILSQVG